MSLITDKVTAIIGDGEAALFTIAQYLMLNPTLPEKSVLWHAGSGVSAWPPINGFEMTPDLAQLSQLLTAWNIDEGGVFRDVSLKEFKNKAFRAATWTKKNNPADQIEHRAALLSGSEVFFAPLAMVRFGKSLLSIEVELREKVLQDPRVQRIESDPIVSLEKKSGCTVLILGSGHSIEVNRVIYADKWSHLSTIQGMPKSGSVLKNRNFSGILQVSFNHSSLAGQFAQDTYFIPVHRDSGETQPRSVFGYFEEQGARSVWTFFLDAAELEDNHTIGKKLRRMKQAIDKALDTKVGDLMQVARSTDGSTESSENVEPKSISFLKGIESEQVRFFESCVFSDGEPITSAGEYSLSSLRKSHEHADLVLVTEGYGVSPLLHQVFQLFPVAFPLSTTLSDAALEGTLGSVLGTPGLHVHEAVEQHFSQSAQ